MDSETCCQVPGRSVNLKSTMRTPCLRAISSTWRGSGRAVSANRCTVSGVWGIAVVTYRLLSSSIGDVVGEDLGVLAGRAGLRQRLDQVVEALPGQRLEHLGQLRDDLHHVAGHPVGADAVSVAAADHHDLLRLGERLRNRGGELWQDRQQAIDDRGVRVLAPGV